MLGDMSVVSGVEEIFGSGMIGMFSYSRNN